MALALSAQVRTEKGANVRSRTIIPAVVYGGNEKPHSLVLNYDEFAKLYHEAGEATLIDLILGGQDGGKVIVQDIQYDPVTDRISHVDLRRIDMNKEMTATVALRFIGEAPAVKEHGGTLMHPIGAVEVRCLPKDLVSHIDVDLSALKTFDDTIKVKDLPVPAGITITSPHTEDLVAKAAPAMTEEEIKAMEAAGAAVDLSAIEVAKKEKKEEESGEGGVEGDEGKKDENKKE